MPVSELAAAGNQPHIRGGKASGTVLRYRRLFIPKKEHVAHVLRIRVLGAYRGGRCHALCPVVAL